MLCYYVTLPLPLFILRDKKIKKQLLFVDWNLNPGLMIILFCFIKTRWIHLHQVTSLFTRQLQCSISLHWTAICFSTINTLHTLLMSIK